MANSNQSKKRARQTIKLRQHNVALGTRMRTFIKRARQAADTADEEQARAAFRDAASVIDKVAAKGILHKRTAARYKKRLAARVKKLAG